MPALPSNTYHTRYGYQFRIVVPEPLRPLIGKREIKKALGKDYRQAVSQARALAVEVDEQFNRARDSLAQRRSRQDTISAYLARPEGKRHKRITTVTPELVEGLKALWLEWLEGDIEWRREGVDEDDYEALTQNTEEMQARIASAIARGRPEPFFPAIELLLHGRGYELDVSSEEERRLVLDVLSAFQEGYEVLAQRQAGRLVEPTLPEHAPLPAVWDPPAPARQEGMSWEDLFEHWQQDRLRATSTIGDAERVIRSIKALFPQSSPQTLKRAQITDWLRHQRTTKEHGFGTLKKYAELLGAMYSSAVKDELLEHHPVAGYDYRRFATREGVEDPDEREPFSHEQLQKILSTDGLFSNQRLWGGGDYYTHCWYSLLCLFSGARIGELGRLTVHDISTDPVPHFKIRRGKTRGSVRDVPVHPTLIELGFLDYVKAVRQSGHTSLWPYLTTKAKKGDISEVFGKWINRYLHETLEMPSTVTVHSFRHSFKDFCRNALIPRDVHQALTGHAEKTTVGDSYGKGFSLEVKHRELAKIDVGIAIPRPEAFTGERYPRRLSKTKRRA